MKLYSLGSIIDPKYFITVLYVPRTNAAFPLELYYKNPLPTSPGLYPATLNDCMALLKITTSNTYICYMHPGFISSLRNLLSRE